MSLLSTSQPSGVKVNSNCPLCSSFYAFFPLSTTTLWSLATTHLCWFGQVEQQQDKAGRCYKGVELGGRREHNMHIGESVTSAIVSPPIADADFSFLTPVFSFLSAKVASWADCNLPSIISHFVNLSSQVLHNCKAIRPSAVADSGDDTTNCVSNWFVTQAVVFLAISCVSKDCVSNQWRHLYVEQLEPDYYN